MDRVTMKRLQILLLICCLVSAGLTKPTTVLTNWSDSLKEYSIDAIPEEITSLKIPLFIASNIYSELDDRNITSSIIYNSDSQISLKFANFPIELFPVEDVQEKVAAEEAHSQEVTKVLGDGNAGVQIPVQSSQREDNIFLKGGSAEIKIPEQPFQRREDNVFLKEGSAEVKIPEQPFQRGENNVSLKEESAEIQIPVQSFQGGENNVFLKERNAQKEIPVESENTGDEMMEMIETKTLKEVDTQRAAEATVAEIS